MAGVVEGTVAGRAGGFTIDGGGGRILSATRPSAVPLSTIARTNHDPRLIVTARPHSKRKGVAPQARKRLHGGGLNPSDAAQPDGFPCRFALGWA
jgi:hypothetical protein